MKVTYTTSDGTEFTDSELALAHENAQQKEKQRLDDLFDRFHNLRSVNIYFDRLRIDWLDSKFRFIGTEADLNTVVEVMRFFEQKSEVQLFADVSNANKLQIGDYFCMACYSNIYDGPSSYSRQRFITLRYIEQRLNCKIIIQQEAKE